MFCQTKRGNRSRLKAKRFSKHLLSRFQSNLCRLLKIFFSIFQIVLFFLHEWPFFYFLYIEFEKFLEPKLLKYCDDISYSNCQGSNNIYCLTFGNLSRICHRNISTTQELKISGILYEESKKMSVHVSKILFGKCRQIFRNVINI